VFKFKKKKGSAKKLSDILPKEIAEQQIFTFKYNLHPTLAEKVCEGFITADADILRVIRDGEVLETVKLSDISEFITDIGVGCVFVSYKLKNDDSFHLLCRSDLKFSKNIIRTARKLNLFLEDGKVPALTDLQDRCPKCGRPYRNGAAKCPFCTGKKRFILRTWQLIAPFKFFVFTAVLLFVVVSGLNLLLPYVNRVLVDSYINSPTPQSVDLSAYVLVLLSMLILNFVTKLISMLRSHLLILASTKMTVSLRDTLFDKIQHLSIAKISKRAAGDLMHRVTSDTATMENFLINYLPSVLEQLTIFAAVGIFILIYDPKLFLMIMLPTPLVVFGFNLFWKYMRTLFRKRWFAASKTNSILHDIFSGIRVVKAFGMEHRESKRFDDAAKFEKYMQEKTDCIWSFIMPCLRFMISFGEFIILFYVGNNILDGNMTLGEMAQFSSYTAMIYGPLRMIAHIPRHVMNFATSSSKIYEILDETEEIENPEQPKEVVIEGNIDIENVSFGYENGTEVLHKINFHINKGEFIGIVGASGVGKSTLINLIMRMYDVEDGSIKVDGVDIRDLSQDTLRSQMGVVLQETFLFSGTIYQNICYAKPTATREEIIAVSKLAGCHDFITKLPDGYNTKVGERGYTLSGGERQRVAIARALLHNPKILILDEATASLDTETEKQIQDALARLSSHRTTIAIAHRLSTLRNADRLVVLDKGKIAEIGTHTELLKNKGIYYNLVMAQREMSNM